MLKTILYVLFISIAFSSCGDCIQQKKGVVINKKTGKPIDSVNVHKVGDQQGEYTDSNGSFEIHAASGGLFGCPVLKLAFYKYGYILASRDMSSDTIYMVPNHYSK
ncbi:carboxypeptidase-like regulatory domain-containing protein [Mucilaginibacter gracilis]|nr:carboxypeptidase-like regulatory domain-containing protein [Mucilaginibacter gracilis]